MQVFNFEIQYVKDKEYVVVFHFHEGHFIKETKLDKIKRCYKDDVFFSILFESLSKEARIQEEIDKYYACALDGDILYYKSIICDPEVGDHKKNIIYDCHNILISCYEGFHKTYALVR